jgi:hypothetical protein
LQHHKLRQKQSWTEQVILVTLFKDHSSKIVFKPTDTGKQEILHIFTVFKSTQC